MGAAKVVNGKASSEHEEKNADSGTTDLSIFIT